MGVRLTLHFLFSDDLQSLSRDLIMYWSLIKNILVSDYLMKIHLPTNLSLCTISKV